MCEFGLNITVMDNTTGNPIPGARVTLLLTSSLSGSSNTQEGPIKTADETGLVMWDDSSELINGNYTVKVEAERYLSNEQVLSINCDFNECASCSISVNAELEEKFCDNRTMTLQVRQSGTNTPLAGAAVEMIQETHNGPNSLGVFTVEESGEVVLPIIGNGYYTTLISADGFMNVTTTLRVDVTPDQCVLLAPFKMIPMTPPIKQGCVQVSLTWAEEPKDLDLISSRVNKFNSSEQCLTDECLKDYEQCDGVTRENDIQDGGDTGSETITYCDVEEYSNMVWVDDRSGLGTSLLNSEARLVITNDLGQTQEVTLRPGDEQGEARYWLAGCLTTTSDSFDFLVLNQFTDGQPNLDQPLHCHSRTQLITNPAAPGANVHVSVASTQGTPLAGAMVSLVTSHETYSMVTEEDGQLVLPVTEDGDYSILAKLDGYVPERLNFSLSCEGVVGQCETNVQLSMMTLEEDGGLRIKLNWADDDTRDLDLHLMQVRTSEPRESCHTYWNNMAGCDDTQLDQNLGAALGNNARIDVLEAGAETITIAKFSAKSKYEYLVYVDDNTASGADLTTVKPQVTMTQGNKVENSQMPTLPSSQAASRFWLVGAIQVEGTTFRFVAANTFSLESPWAQAAQAIDNWLSANPTITPPFCEGISLDITIMDSITHVGPASAVATVLKLSEEGEMVVAESVAIDAQGEVRVPITEAGQYEVQVEGPGYISARQSMFINCETYDCGSCAPTMTVGLSPELSQNQLRLTLGSQKDLNNLDLYAVHRDDFISCVTTPNEASNCANVEKVTGAGDQGIQTITFDQPADGTPSVYTIFIEWNAPASEVGEKLGGTDAFISLSDGTITEEIKMDATEFGGERRWLAGCLLLSGSANDPSYQLRPLKVFFTERPDTEVPDKCLEVFDLMPEAIKWEGQCIIDTPKRELSVNFGSSSYNSPEYCIAKCKSHKFLYAGVQYTRQCFCGNVAPERDVIVDDLQCDKKCPADSAKACGGTWRMNTYETGYKDGMPLPPGTSCDCSYTLGGCKISRAAPTGYACNCKKKGWWSCKGEIKLCSESKECPKNCKSKTCCKNGGGNCGGYWW